jgi:hypothetical protein
MPGNITRATDKSIEETISGLRTALAVIDNANKIFVPPIPRYMFGGCCADSSHAPNTKEPDHAKDTLTDHTRIRNKLKQCIITKGKTNTRILDVISALAEDHHSPTDKIKALRIHTSSDNVHLTPQGYNLLAKAIINTSFATHRPTQTQHKYAPHRQSGTGGGSSPQPASARPRLHPQQGGRLYVTIPTGASKPANRLATDELKREPIYMRHCGNAAQHSLKTI